MTVGRLPPVHKSIGALSAGVTSRIKAIAGTDKAALARLQDMDAELAWRSGPAIGDVNPPARRATAVSITWVDDQPRLSADAALFAAMGMGTRTEIQAGLNLNPLKKVKSDQIYPAGSVRTATAIRSDP